MFEIPDSLCETNWDVVYYSYKYSGIVKDQKYPKIRLLGVRLHKL